VAFNLRDGHCRAFDAKAKGIVGGDAVGVIVLKRLSDAIEDGDHIHAVIKGSACNNDGSLKIGFTAPSIEGQARTIAEAHAMAGVSADTITYVEAHGTGTNLGDPIEVARFDEEFSSNNRSKKLLRYRLGEVEPRPYGCGRRRSQHDQDRPRAREQDDPAESAFRGAEPADRFRRQSVLSSTRS
jgi:hypothetical protein